MKVAVRMQAISVSPARARHLTINVHPSLIGEHGHRYSLDTNTGEKGPCRIIFGDYQDVTDSADFLGNGIVVEIGDDQTMEIFSSLSGNPVLYRQNTEGSTLFATDLRSLVEHSRLRLRLDWHTVAQMGLYGRPDPGHTLFDGIEIVDPGTHIRVTRDGEVSIIGHFEPASVQLSTHDDYLHAQRDAFRNAVRRMRLDDAFLSLTAGLDTRAILALIVSEGREVETATIGDPDRSIDAMRARELSRTYGLEHTVVTLDHAYREALPSLCESVSRRTGGLSSFAEAPDLWLYEQLNGRYEARISGNLGNQVGRKGTEGVSTRGARLDTLAGDGAVDPSVGGRKHWMLDAAGDMALASPRFLIQVESLCSSVANYCLGSSFCEQRTPYADHDLIALSLGRPTLDSPRSLGAIRARDLWYRFMGAPADRSFQRQVIIDAGGFVSDCPVNWGWRPRGGFDPAGMVRGLGAFADLGLGKFGRRLPVVNRARFALGVAGVAELERREHMYHGLMPEYVRDIVFSREVRESGVFEMKRVAPLVTDGFYDRRNFSSIEFVLDIALAVRNFL